MLQNEKKTERKKEDNVRNRTTGRMCAQTISARGEIYTHTALHSQRTAVVIPVR